MSLSDLASLGSFVSGLAVLASLVYLTLQVRQAERYQRANVLQERASRVIDLNLRLADSELQEALNKGSSGDDDISLVQLGQFRRLVNAGLFNNEDTFRQHTAGLIGDDVFDGMRSFLKITAAQAGWRAMWKRVRVAHGKDFREFVDQIVAETPVTGPEDNLVDWRAAVAAERTNLANA